jgi:hypothetical protein
MSEQKGYETRDISGKAVEVFGLGLALTIALVMVLLGGLMVIYINLADRSDPEPLPVESEAEVLHERDLPVGGAQLRQLRRTEEQGLATYGIDTATGRIRIPIERAMELVLERGLPARETPK